MGNGPLVVREGQAEVGKINDNLSRSLSGYLEGVLYGFAQGEDREAGKVDVEDNHGGVLSV